MNNRYGIGKGVGLLFIIIPLTILLIRYVRINAELTFEVIKELFILAGVVLTILILITKPFIFDNKENLFGFTHVGFGRLVSIGWVVAVGRILFNNKIKLNDFLFMVFLSLGLLISGLRGGLVATCLTFCMMIFFAIYKRGVKTLHFCTLSGAIVLSTVLFLLMPEYSTSNLKRFNNLGHVLSKREYTNDGSIYVRKKGLLIAWEMFLEKPVLGQGLGGYKHTHTSVISEKIEYPHNLVVEILVELGLVGLLLFLILTSAAAKELLKFDVTVFFIFINSFYLSMFSGNFLDQKLFLVLLGTALVIFNLSPIKSKREPYEQT